MVYILFLIHSCFNCNSGVTCNSKNAFLSILMTDLTWKEYTIVITENVTICYWQKYESSSKLETIYRTKIRKYPSEGTCLILVQTAFFSLGLIVVSAYFLICCDLKNLIHVENGKGGLLHASCSWCTIIVIYYSWEVPLFRVIILSPS